MDSALEDVLDSVGVEWRLANKKLKHDDAQSPPVNSCAIALPQDHLGSNVVWCPQHLIVSVKGRKAVRGGERNISRMMALLSHLAVLEACGAVGGGVHHGSLAHQPDARQPEVCQLDVSIRCQDQVVGFEVAVHDAVVVDVLQRQHLASENQHSNEKKKFFREINDEKRVEKGFKPSLPRSGVFLAR